MQDGHIGIGWAEKATRDKSIQKEKNFQDRPGGESAGRFCRCWRREVMVRVKAGEVDGGLIRETFWELRLYPDDNQEPCSSL